MNTITINKIPQYFKPIMWSYDFEKLDTQNNKRDIIINTLNYGNLDHWVWVMKNYGKTNVWQIAKRSRPTELRLGARRLAEVIFGQNNNEHRAHRTGQENIS